MVLGNGVWINNELWYWDVSKGALCTLNLKSKRISVKYVDVSFPGYKVFGYGDDIYVTCQREERVLIFHQRTKNTEEIQLSEGNDGDVVYSPVQWENCIYYIPLDLKCQIIICYDMSTGKSFSDESIISGLEVLKDSIPKEATFMFPSICEGVLWGAISYTNRYFSYHLATGEFCIYQSKLGDSLLAVKCDENMIYLTQTDRFDLIVKRQGGAEFVLPIEVGECEVKEPYSCIESLTDYQVVLARKGRYIVVLDSKSLECKTICPYEETEEEHAASRSICCVEDEVYIYVFPWRLENVYAIRKGTWEVEKRKFEIDIISYSEHYGKVYFESKEEGKIVWENAEISLQNLCIYLANNECY